MPDIRRIARYLGLALPCAMLMTCGDSMVSEYTVLDRSTAPLRSHFNADSGKVRAIFLASPT